MHGIAVIHLTFPPLPVCQREQRNDAVGGSERGYIFRCVRVSHGHGKFGRGWIVMFSKKEGTPTPPGMTLFTEFSVQFTDVYGKSTCL
jgi:hypothetical protein